MRILKSDWIAILQVLYISSITLGMSFAVGLATQAHSLIWLALPLGVGLVAAMMWLPARAQLLGWAAATVWLLSMTYLGTGEPIEYVALAIVLLLSIAGVFWSPWALVAVWFFHPMWDLIPRSLPSNLHDLPFACLLYDLVVGFYLGWRTYRKFFTAFALPSNIAPRMIRSGWSRSLTALYGLTVIVIQILLIGSITMSASSVWFAVPMALLVIVAIFWLPRVAQLAFLAVATGWMGMTYAHSGSPVELVLFLAILMLAVLGFRVSPYYLVMAWAFHAVWNLLPHSMNMATSMMMGHWMDPVAAFLFEISIASYILIAMNWGRLRPIRAAYQP